MSNKEKGIWSIGNVSKNTSTEFSEPQTTEDYSQIYFAQMDFKN
jgi:hypothetical protein